MEHLLLIKAGQILHLPTLYRKHAAIAHNPDLSLRGASCATKQSHFCSTGIASQKALAMTDLWMAYQRTVGGIIPVVLQW
jgi:hypothetical protein